MLQEIYNFLAISLERRQKPLILNTVTKKKLSFDQNLTPQTFFEKYVGVNLHDYVSIINAPTEDKPFNKTYTVEMLGNVVGGKEVKYLNVEMAAFKN